MIRRITHLLGLDRAVAYSVGSFMVPAIAVPITSWLIITRLTLEEQGYYYTFTSLLALQMLFELGFSQCVIQFIAHEFAHLELKGNGELVGKKKSRDRLIAISQCSIRMYAIISVAAFLGLTGAGFLFFDRKSPVEWQVAWMMMCGTTAIALFTSGIQSILQGCQEVAWVAKFRFFGNLVRTVILCVAFTLGLKLFSPALAGLVSLGVAIFLLVRNWRAFISYLFNSSLDGAPNFSWRREIWPFQWRFAISWVCGFFIFSVLNPIAFRFCGPEAAGKFGFTWVLLQNISAIANSWSATKIPRYCALISKEDWSGFEALWKKTSGLSFLMCCLGCGVLISLVALVDAFNLHYAGRMLGIVATLFLVVAFLASNIINAFACYLRAFNTEPLMGFSVAWAIAVLVVALGTVSRFGVTGIALGYSIVAVVSLPFAWRIFCLKKENR